MGISKYAKSLFSRNMEDISLILNGEAKTPIVVRYKDAGVIVFTLFAVDDKVSIHTSEIADNFQFSFNPYIERWDTIRSVIEEISIQSRDENDEVTDWSERIPVLFGGYDNSRLLDEYDFLQHNFLTWRPQIDYVVPGIKEQLSFVICNEGADTNESYPEETSRRIYAKIYFRSLAPTTKLLCEVNTDMSIYRLDCSYDHIANLVAEEFDDEVVAYDIYGDTDADNGVVGIKPQRFVVRPQTASNTYFFFQNSLGGFDTIIATGELKTIADGDNLTAMVRKTESEVYNGYVRSWEVNTGYITTKQEENLWHEFLRSTNRYILFDDGSYRKIIVEEYKAERVKLQMDSFTFKFHYSEAAKGGFAEKSETLPDFFL